MLTVSRALTALNVSDSGLTCKVATYIASRLAQNTLLKTVVLHSNQIGSAGAVSIFRSLEHNTSLEELDIMIPPSPLDLPLQTELPGT